MDIETIEEMEGDETMKGKERITYHETIDSSKPMSMKSITHTKDNNTIDSSKPTQTMTGNEQYQMMIH